MSRARDWAWEHVWLAFSLFGMLLCNWLLTLLVLPNPPAIFAGVPRREILILAGFGLAWGAGAVLFGMAMDMLGLALGYPLIMGLNASVGTFVPLLWFDGASVLQGRKLFISVGTIVAIAGISACSVAGGRRQSSADRTASASRARFVPGLVIAVASGTLSCLPNIGLVHGTTTIRQARSLGASPAFAGDAIWLIFFTFGGLVNLVYCFQLIIRRKTLCALFARDRIVNWCLSLAMGGMWIASFYLYLLWSWDGAAWPQWRHDRMAHSCLRVDRGRCAVRPWKRRVGRRPGAGNEPTLVWAGLDCSCRPADSLRGSLLLRAPPGRILDVGVTPPRGRMFLNDLCF
jgi:L-rhamnose-H+ transport protein